MTPLQTSLTILACLLGLGGFAFAYVIHLANAMKTTGPPLSAGGTALALSPALLTLALELGQWALARQTGNVLRAMLWNAPAILGMGLTLVLTASAWIGDRPAVRRRATERRRRAESRAMVEVWERSGRLSAWDLHVERGYQTSFTGADGSSRPGVDWIIVFKVDGAEHSVKVRSFSAAAAPIQIEQHTRFVLHELDRRLTGGWRPDAGDPTPIDLTIPA